MGPRKGVLISEVSLIRRLHYSIANNSGPWTLVLISEVSAIGVVRFRRFHCIYILPCGRYTLSDITLMYICTELQTS